MQSKSFLYFTIYSYGWSNHLYTIIAYPLFILMALIIHLIVICFSQKRSAYEDCLPPAKKQRIAHSQKPSTQASIVLPSHPVTTPKTSEISQESLRYSATSTFTILLSQIQYNIVPFCPYHFFRIPFCPIHFCPHTILSICPHTILSGHRYAYSTLMLKEKIIRL